ncbi:MAG: hypothetical protein WC371_04105 [Parachlamydiales bacterium]|jgi:hypothetical protein
MSFKLSYQKFKTSFFRLFQESRRLLHLKPKKALGKQSHELANLILAEKLQFKKETKKLLPKKSVKE